MNKAIMKPNTLDENIIGILNSAIQSGDCSLLFDSFNGENSYLENLHSIYLQLGEAISEQNNDLPKIDILISNSLQILTELITAYGIRDDMCVHLARTVLLLITEEQCSIINIKRAINVLNLVLVNASIKSTIVTDESLEGSLQIFGRKVPGVGDYECQALIYEALFRITCDENRDFWASIWFVDEIAKNMFVTLDPQKFELNCRKALNYINRNESDRTVYSFIANSILFGSFQMHEPQGSQFWVDFNYGSESISFYCSEISVDEALNESSYWETILIPSQCVRSFSIEDNARREMKEVTVLLNCPCHTLTTSSNISNAAFNSYDIKLLFLNALDIDEHFERIFGKDKYVAGPFSQSTLSQCQKVSRFLDVIQISGNLPESNSRESIPRRKVSSSALISVDTFETEPQTIPQRKVSNSTLISIDASEIENVIPDTFENQLSSKVSQTSEIIPVVFENEVIQNSPVLQKTKTGQKASFSTVCLEMNARVDHNQKKKKKHDTRLSRNKSPSFTALEKTECEETAVSVAFNQNKLVKKESDSPLICVNTFEPDFPNLNTNYSPKETVSSVVNVNDGKNTSEIIDINDSEKSYSQSKNVVASVRPGNPCKIGTLNIVHSKNAMQHENNNGNLPIFENFVLKKTPKRDSSVEKHDGFQNTKDLPDSLEDFKNVSPKHSKRIKSLRSASLTPNKEEESHQPRKKKSMSTRLSLRKRAAETSSTSVCPSSPSTRFKHFKIDTNVTEANSEKNIKMMNELPQKSVAEENVVKNLFNVRNETNVNLGKQDDNYLDDNLESRYVDNPVSISKENCSAVVTVLQDISPKLMSKHGEKSSILNNDEIDKCKSRSESIVSLEIEYEDYLVRSEINISENIVKENYDTNIAVLRNETTVVERDISNGKIVKNSTEERFLTEKLDACAVIKQDNLRNEDKTEKVNEDYSQGFNKSSSRSTDFDTAKSQSKKVRLYNIDSAPIYDVPPLSSSLRLTEKTANGKTAVLEENHPAINVVRSNEVGEKSSDSHKSLSQKRSLGDFESQDLSKKIKIYDIIPNSDSDFQEQGANRYSSRRKRRSRGVSASSGKSSKKRKSDASDSNNSEPYQNRRSTRLLRASAVKAMKVNKRILDQTPEVTCDRIELMTESGEVTPKTKSRKKRKYSKVFSTLQSDTETGSSEISWLKQKAHPLFESPKRNYSEWRKSQHKKRSLPVKIVPQLNSARKSSQHVSQLNSPERKSNRRVSQPNSRLRKTNKQMNKTLRREVNVETGSKSKSFGWSDLENFNLTIERSTRKSYSVLKTFEKDLQSRSRSSHEKSLTERGAHHTEQNIEAAISIERAYGSDLNLSENDIPYTIFKETETAEAQNVGYNNLCVNDQDNNSKSIHYIDNNCNLHQVISKVETNRRETSNSNEDVLSDSAALQKIINGDAHVMELEESISGKRRHEVESTLDPVIACTSGLKPGEDFATTFTELEDEVTGKQQHLDRFLECSLRCSSSFMDSSKSMNNETECNMCLGLLESDKDNTDSGRKSEESDESKIHRRKRKLSEIKTNASSLSRSQRKKQKLTTIKHTLLKKSLQRDVASQKLKHFKDLSPDGLDTTPIFTEDFHEENNEKGDSNEFVNKVKKQKHTTSKQYKNSSTKPLHNFMESKCSITDSMRPGTSGNEKFLSDVSRISDRLWFKDEIAKKSTPKKMNKFETFTNGNKQKSKDVHSTSFSSKITTFSIKEDGSDTPWFTIIASALSEEANTLNKKLLGTVQKCFFDYSNKMHYLRENILQNIESLMPTAKDIEPQKLENLLKSFHKIRTEAEKSLKEMLCVGRAYFDAEEKCYRKLEIKYMKANKKYASSMKTAESNAIAKLEKNLILKTKYFTKMFMKYINSA